MKKYFTLIKLNIQRHLMFRARVAIWIVCDLGQYAIMPFVWLAVYASGAMIGEYTREGIVSYYLVAAFVQATTASHRGGYIADEIRTGNVTKDLLRPLQYLYVHIIGEFSYKITSLIVSAALLFIAFSVGPGYFPAVPSLLTLVFFTLAIGCAFLFSFLLDAIVGLSSFWLGDSNAFFRIRWFLEKVFGGGLAPLTFLPLFLRGIAFASPFQYLSYFPIQIYLQKMEVSKILQHFAVFGGWIFISILLVIFMWKRGLKRYDGGGI